MKDKTVKMLGHKTVLVWIKSYSIPIHNVYSDKLQKQ